MAMGYNTPITFGRNGTAKTLNCSGVDFSDAAQSWTTAPLVEMDILLAQARQEVHVQIEASPYIVPGIIEFQPVSVYMDGLFTGFCKFTEYDVKTFIVNRSAISGRPGRLSLVLHNATSPSSVNESEDARELGIYLHSIVFKTTR